MADYLVEEYYSPSVRRDRKYALYLPSGSSPRTFPILFLHGSGECGDDIHAAAMRHGPMRNAKRQSLPYVIITPQLPNEYRNDEREWLCALNDVDVILDDVTRKHSVSTNTLILTGISMGGTGAWELGASGLRKWSKIAPFSGGCAESSVPDDVARRIGGTPCWAFVNLNELFPELVLQTKAMVAAVEQNGGSVRYSYFKTWMPKHDCWARAYNGEPLPSECKKGALHRRSIYEWFDDRS